METNETNEAVETNEELETKETNEEKTFTEKEFQSEIDRRVNSALEKAQEKAELERQQAVKEAEKRAKMTAQEKAVADAKKIEEKYNAKLKELELKEEKATIKATLISKGLDEKWLDVLYFGETTKEELVESINTLIEDIRTSEAKKVKEELLKGKTPAKNVDKVDFKNEDKQKGYAYYSNLSD